MAVPYFKDRFNHFMEQALNSVFIESDLITELEQTQAVILQAGLDDTYKELDYGFSDTDFQNGLLTAYGIHVTYSIQGYLNSRIQAATNQLISSQYLVNPCQNSGVDEISATDFQPIQAIDLLGREVNPKTTNQLIILKDHFGRTKKQVIVYE
jgi:hypothetical protein